LDAKNVPDAARQHRGGPIHLGILSRLEIDDLLALGSTCKQTRLSLQQILRNFYNINKQLEPWFTDPKAFGSFQAQCNILIGRTFARWFFSRYRMAKHTDPCLYFNKKYLDTVREYLKSDGYFEKLCDRSWKKIFCKLDNIAGIERVVYCQPTDGAPVHDLLAFAITTAEPQFIARNNAYSVYPCIAFV
jgi:hypothetical protein